MKPSLIDMHCHTTNSDGAQSPEEVYAKSQELGITVFAITDHDIVTRHPDYPAGIQKDGQLILEGVEVSARYESDDYRKSLHIPIYALSLKGELEDILTGIRRGKAEKVQRQCERLRTNGCMIELPDKRIVPFSFEAMRACFPHTKEEGFNNAHLVELLKRYKKNLKTLENLAPGITEDNLLKEGFKSEGQYTKIISLPERPPEYEPRVEELVEAVSDRTTLISIAHPNYTFRTREEFMKRVGALYALGVNAVEINSTATEEWIEAIETFRSWQSESFAPQLIRTFGSDCHDLYPSKKDDCHGLLGDMTLAIPSKRQRISMDYIINSHFGTI